MSACPTIRRLLPQSVDRELSPRASLAVARHLSDCTACRIVLARERRLAGILEAFEDSLPVDGQFVADVMASLPEQPPARRKQSGGLRIVVLAGLVALGLGSLTQGALALSGPQLLPGLPRLSYEGLASLAQGVVSALQLLLGAAAKISSVVSLDAPSLPGFILAGQALATTAFAALAATASAVLVTRRYLAGTSSPRALIRSLRS